MNVKISDSQIPAIQYAYKVGGERLSDLAEYYGVCRNQISRIVRGERKNTGVDKVQPLDHDRIRAFLKKKGYEVDHGC